ncbi:ATP-grasp domain-containing protein [Clostridia bacterium]|nr:ATP-grasp domain-containing protein [Clostridia bacterium]
MIIIDKPYISEDLKNYLDLCQIPVLKSQISIRENEEHSFNLISDTDFIKIFDKNSRLYTLSENSLDWVKKNIDDKSLLNSINIMKDKFAFREKISSLYPSFYFKKVCIDDLEKLEIDKSKFPLILKPVVGFFSAGVYALSDELDFKTAIEDIKESYGKWKSIFPTTVVGEHEFILEQYITGDEYAIDAYFDENGQAVVLNIMVHEFLSQSDVSDTLYYTSKEILEKYVVVFEDYLNSINAVLGVKNFPFHAEVRVNEKNEIAPIEFNPLRFAGWSTTDITNFAFGFFTYDYYFNNKRPDWKELLKGKDDKKYTLILLNKPSSYSIGDIFDFEMLKKDFIKILCLRELDYTKTENPFGFLFTETPYCNLAELTKITTSDLSEYITKQDSLYTEQPEK